MPMARISLRKGKSLDYLKALSDGVYRAMVEAFDVPKNDLFQIIHQHEPEELVFDPHYKGGPRSDDFVLVCITAGKPRSTAMKEGFCRHLTKVLAEAPGIRPEDVMVIISMTEFDGWSFSGGELSLFPKELPQ
ncbi:tautomerase family protein [Noviherbaspirillum galbum]|uniref:Tautomerase family protein n=1 Tax=Noviherbaspirillum galbum TaxID=2709383 RepID=A0A6B3SNL1_9BURK|nr:tautomerase family protein [Noviherbaspirillum galbum]NEX62394.1 tautomerase family protein [Noviherbaspirillum galbum]